ncbi:MAG: hypothetical protein LIO79_05400 [Rikenellaceae bacterium]|nr:hypothetical protein [Rikenellaceae bacterium]
MTYKSYLLLYLGLFLIFIGLISCHRRGNNSLLIEALDISGDNKIELLKVLGNYDKNTQRYKASVFLIENMKDHQNVESNLLDLYRNEMLAQSNRLQYKNIWDSISNNFEDESIYFYDLNNIKAEYLIKNIDDAFDTWEKAPWYNEIDFDIFCKYILPYKIKDEPIVEWRSTLKEIYQPLIDTIQDMQTAYEIIYNRIQKLYRPGSLNCPYTRDPIILNSALFGDCHISSFYTVFVMRALGIPASLDYTPKWANYGNNTHTWVSLIKKDGKTFTIPSDSTHAYEFGPIDGTIIGINYPFDNSATEYIIDTVKKISKVYRNEYQLLDQNEINNIYGNHIKDVSKYYGKTTSIKLRFDEKFNGTEIYLCTFISKDEWFPIAKTIVKNKKAEFKDLESDIVYIPAIYFYSQLTTMGNPLILKNNSQKKYLNPDPNVTEEVKLKRKYILMGNWIYRWGQFVGSKFEGSNDPQFLNSVRLFKIDSIPFGEQEVFLENANFRYIRFLHSPREDSTERYKVPNFAELSFFDREGKIDLMNYVTIKGNNIDNVHNTVSLLFDKKNYTSTQWRSPYEMEFDFKKPENITKIIYTPITDDNFINKGHKYELFYFDEDWISLGEYIPDNNFITTNVPTNSLLLLRNKTIGKEERIFTIENCKQVWW